VPGKGRSLYMTRNNVAKTAKEFDRRFDQGEDIHELLDMSKVKISKPGKKIRITLDMAEDLVNEIDRIRAAIGVDRAALIKIWLHERVKEEKLSSIQLLTSRI
jgi:hypothetical protein